MTALAALPQFVAMTVLALVARRFVMRPAAAPTAAGSIVMAVGIFAVAPLQQMPALRAALTHPLAIGLFVLWAFIAASYLGSLRSGAFGRHVDPPVGRFAIGSWVAGTAMLVRLIVLGAPELRILAALLGVLACAIWLWFVALAVRALRAVVREASRAPAPGVILLSTVSTQSLALAALDLLPHRQPFHALATGVIALGVLFYLVGAALVVRSHFAAAKWTLADDWDNTNCILHGAMSITGLAVVAWAAAPASVALLIWLYALCVFIAVEAIELARMLARVRAYGWRRGLFSYRVTQWSRNFTFGMFYAFTLALSQQRAGLDDPLWLEAARDWVLACGPYLVLALLLGQAALYLDDSLDRGAFTSLLRARRRPDRAC